MATTKQRITVTLTDHQYGVLKAISDANGQPMSKIIVELLDAGIPTLERMALALQAISKAQSAQREKLAAALDDAQTALEPLLMQAAGQYDIFVESMAAAVSEEPAAEEGGGGPARGGVLPSSAAGARRAGPRPVITGATEGQRSAQQVEGRAEPVVLKAKRRKASERVGYAKVLADADNNGKGAKLLVSGASRRAK